MEVEVEVEVGAGVGVGVEVVREKGRGWREGGVRSAASDTYL